MSNEVKKKNKGEKKLKFKNKDGKLKKRKNGVDKKNKKPKRTDEIAELEKRILAETPDRNAIVFAEKDDSTKEKGPEITTSKFTELPLSSKTQISLKNHQFIKLTAIQKYAIPHALAGRDICGEAKTGSGKTLAFLIPLIELLYRRRWSRQDGLGAIVIAPTRELAFQIFQELKKVGGKHDFSAGCIVGGRDIDEESTRVGSMNILIATPGRLLQHLDENPNFETSNLQMLVVDEADRILDLGFRESMKNILEGLPQDRQTLVFSATMKNSVQQLVTLSMKQPVMVNVSQSSSSATPSKLKQVYMKVPLELKINTLFSFLRSHSQKRCIVFVSTCKQARYLYESLYKLKPGPAVMELHGRQSLEKRMMVFQQFLEKPRSVTLICTDIAARGLDFPDVDWVIQVDCPDSIDSYIHRVGRTARYQASGHALLMLTPTEEPFIQELEKAKVNISFMKMKQNKLIDVTHKLQALLSHSQDINYLANRAFISYIRSIQFMSNKELFDVSTLPIDAFASSLGLSKTPEIDLTKDLGSGKKNMSKLERLKAKIKEKKEQKKKELAAAKENGLTPQEAKAKLTEEPDVDSSDAEEEKKRQEKTKSKWDRRQEKLAKQRAEQIARAEAAVKNNDLEAPEMVEDDLLVKKEAFATPNNAAEESIIARKPNKLKLRKDGTARGVNMHHARFIEDEEELQEGVTSLLAQAAAEANAAGIEDDEEEVEEVASESREAFLEKVKKRLSKTKDMDKEYARRKIREKHLKMKERKARNALADEEMQATLGSGSDEEINDNENDEQSNSVSENDDYQDGANDEVDDDDDNFSDEDEEKPSAKRQKVDNLEEQAMNRLKLLGYV